MRSKSTKGRNRRRRANNDILMVRTNYAEAKKARQRKGSTKQEAPVHDERMVAVAGGITLVLVVVALVIGFGAMRKAMFEHNPRFTLQTIQADSDGVLKRAHLLAYAELEEGGNLFAFDLEALRQRLELQPIIKDATVRRTLPDRLDIAVTERKPLARLGHAGVQYHLIVDEEGVLIRKDYRSTHLPLIYGIDHTRFELGDSIADTTARDALTAIKICGDRRLSGVLRLEAVVVGHDEYLTLRLKSGVRVIIPRHGIRDSLRYAAAAVTATREEGEVVEEIDLRYGKGRNGEIPVVVKTPEAVVER